MVPRTLNVNDGCLLAFLHLPASLQSCHDFLSVSCVICAFCFHPPATWVQDVLDGQEGFLWCLQLSNTPTSWNLCVWLCAQCFCLKTIKLLSSCLWVLWQRRRKKKHILTCRYLRFRQRDWLRLPTFQLG